MCQFSKPYFFTPFGSMWQKKKKSHQWHFYVKVQENVMMRIWELATGEVTKDEYKKCCEINVSDKDKNDIEKECSHSENWNGKRCWKETGILKVNRKGRNSDGSQTLFSFPPQRFTF